MTEMKAHQTEEYKLWQQFKIANKTIQEVIRAIKKRLYNFNAEWKDGQNF